MSKGPAPKVGMLDLRAGALGPTPGNFRRGVKGMKENEVMSPGLGA